MRKLVALLTLIALLCAGALAEESAFAIRNGVTWGMTPAQVLAAEGEPAYAEIPIDDRLTLLAINLDMVGVLDYVFLDGLLAEVAYSFDGGAVNAETLQQALDAKYAPLAFDFQRFLAVEGRVYGDSYAWPEPDGGNYRSWEAADGSYIVMAIENTVTILYYSEARLLAK